MKAKSLMIGLVTVATIAAVPANTFAGFFPSDRPTYTCGATRPDGTTPCEGADHVVFNSFTNNPVVGDERPFLAGSMNGGNVQDRVLVKNGDVVTLRIYVHNNADPNKIGAEAAKAKNVRVSVLVPNDTKADHNLTAYIKAANANPGTVTDTMSIAGDKAMSLEYVKGSAKFDHKADGVNRRVDAVDDSIVTQNGASLGDINGCFQYSGYVTVQVKVTMKTDTPPVTPPETPQTPGTPQVTTPEVLPNTGAGDVAAIAAATSLAGAFGYRRFLSRRASN